jgi:hypothetical protein
VFIYSLAVVELLRDKPQERYQLYVYNDGCVLGVYSVYGNFYFLATCQAHTLALKFSVDAKSSSDHSSTSRLETD